MLKKLTLGLVFCVGLLPLFLLSMDNGSPRFTEENIWNSIHSWCEDEVRLLGRSQLQADIHDFRRSTRTKFLISYLPVVSSDEKIRIINVALVKRDIAVDGLDAAITMMSISESRK